MDIRENAFIDALKPRRAGTPIVAVLAANQGTEVSDFLLPYALLQRAAVANVHAVALRRGQVILFPALQIEVKQDLSDFDRAYPTGADYVIVPALDRDGHPAVHDPAITGWLQRQAQHGARILSICAGALALARAGLLDHRRFVSHWHYLSRILKTRPSAIYVPNQRYVVDGNIATTTGITASMPATLALIEALGGRGKAQALADELGVNSWTSQHDSALFALNVRRVWSYLLNEAAFWRSERWSIAVCDGMDDVTLALIVDAWSRTKRVDIAATSPSGAVRLRSGITLLAQPSAEGLHQLPLTPGLKPMQQLDRTLCEIAERYGKSRREWVMLEMEYAGAQD
jgi:putative intracellular protease/amidase